MKEPVQSPAREFDAEAAHLDLVVGTAEVLQLPVGGPAAEVAGAEHPVATAEEGVGGVALGVEGVVAEVAGGDAVAAGPHLAGFADGQGAAVGVEDVDGVVGSGAADGEQRSGRVVAAHRVDDRRLGRAAAVEEGGLPGPAVGQRARTGLPRDGDPAHPGAGRRVQPGQHGRGRDQHVGGAGRGGDVMAADDEGAAVGEAAEDLPGGHVEGDVEELCDAVAGPDAEAARFREQEVGDVAVGDLHAVGAAGGAGGEQDVGAVAAGDADARGRGAGQWLVEGKQQVAVRQGHAVGVFGDGEDDPGAGGADDVGELGGGRETDVLRNVGGAGLEDAEQADQHRDRAADEQADVVAGADTFADQAGGEGAGVAVEFAVGDAGVPVLGGDGVRGGRGVPGDGVVQERVGDGDGGAVAVLAEEPLVVGGQVAQRHGRVASWLFRGRIATRGPAAGGCCRERRACPGVERRAESCERCA